MASIVLKGRIAAIGSVYLVGEKHTEVQSLILHVAAYTDGFGDKKGKDQQWHFQAVGKKVAELKMSNALVDKKIELKGYVESVCLEPKEAGNDPFYAVNCTIASFEIIP